MSHKTGVWGIEAQERSRKRREYFRKYRLAHPQLNQRGPGWQRKKRLRLIDLLGAVCVNCGFSNPLALQIDHVNGNGHKELVSIGHQYSLKEIKANLTTGKYQLLCANCNWIKRMQNNKLYGNEVVRMDDTEKKVEEPTTAPEGTEESAENGDTQPETTETETPKE